jgi:hypothetical protein
MHGRENTRENTHVGVHVAGGRAGRIQIAAKEAALMNSPVTVEGPLADLHRAARTLRVPASWLKQEAAAGRVPCLRAGARLLFNLDALRQILAKRAAKVEEVEHGC